MALEHPQLKAPKSTSNEKKVKRGKSLTRSLSTAFRKSVKSRPSSPNPEQPVTPQLPAHLRPWTADVCYRDDDDAQPSPKNAGTDSKNPPAEDHSYKALESDDPPLQIRKSRSLRHLSIGHARQKSWVSGDDTTRPQTANTLRNHEHSSMPTSNDSHKSPGPKKTKSKTSLRITAGRITSKDRSASATEPASKVLSALPSSSRPATFGASATSPKASGKNRHRGNSSPVDETSKPPSDYLDIPPSPQLPWQKTDPFSDGRSSFKSAYTAASSRTTTTRNSIMTKDTAMTEVFTDTASLPEIKDKDDEGMTVDEAIEMYAAGFTDDPHPSATPEPSMEANTLHAEEDGRSASIAQALEAKIGSTDAPDTPTSARPSTSVSGRSGSFRSPSFAPSTLSHGATFPYGPTRDQYGFLKYNHHIDRSTYDDWFSHYNPSQIRRNHKWSLYMREHKLPTEEPTKFPSRSAKTQRYIRKGIPPAWRGAAWFYYAGGHSYVARHPQLYNNLIHLTDQKLADAEKEAIERDLHRTFPDNVRFKPETAAQDAQETELLGSLRRVLRAFALHKPKIGYCQSLNFVAALLLLFLPEEKAFWVLHIITLQYLPATHETSLEGANIDVWVLAAALKKDNPSLWARVGETETSDAKTGRTRLPPISLCTTSWFMGMFIGTLPIETVLRAWDVLFYEGSRTIFRVAVAIFKLGEQSVKTVKDPTELFQIVQSLPRSMIDASKFMEVAVSRQIGADWVERMRGERRMFYAKQRARAAGTAALETHLDEEFDAIESLERKKSIWRRKASVKVS